MEKRNLGNTGLEVSAIGLGCMGMSQSYGTPEERDERESVATIHRAPRGTGGAGSYLGSDVSAADAL